jgi:hypothetical protein
MEVGSPRGPEAVDASSGNIAGMGVEAVGGGLAVRQAEVRRSIPMGGDMGGHTKPVPGIATPEGEAAVRASMDHVLDRARASKSSRARANRVS